MIPVARPWGDAFDAPAPDWMTRWPRVAPHPARAWTVSDGAVYGLFDPSEQRFTTLSPTSDRRLPGLSRALDGGELVAYRHRRRAVVRQADRFVKIVRPERVDELVTRHELASRRRTYVSPLVLAHSDDGRVELETLRGVSLHDQLRRRRSIDMDHVAQLLAGLGSTDASTLPEASVDTPQRWIDTVARIEPDLRCPLEEVSRTLPTVDVSGTAFVHGDLHDKNVMILPRNAAGGTSFGVIDLDSACRGAPELDVANLAIHLELRALQAGRSADVGARRSARLIAASSAERDLDLALVHDLQRHGWFRLACLYRCRPSGRHLTEYLLNRCVRPSESRPPRTRMR